MKILTTEICSYMLVMLQELAIYIHNSIAGRGEANMPAIILGIIGC